VSRGQPIGELDMMIAAHSLSAGAVLVTNDHRYFERINAPLMLTNRKSHERSFAVDKVRTVPLPKFGL
jgi:hypothetical protein